MASVILKDVVKRYGDRPPVVAGVNLEIRDRELLVMTGPSGCGKSTLLRLVAGLEAVTSGIIRIGGRVVNDLPPRERDTAMVTYSCALYPHMSARRQLEFGLDLRGIMRPEIDRLVRYAARLVDIEPCLERRPGALSPDERQRVALGCAVARRPAVLLLDEPLVDLDGRLRAEMRARITKVQERLELTSIYVTHDPVEGMKVGDRIAILNDGVLEQVGTPREVYERPDNLFVAKFVGTPPMSFVRATVTDAGRQLSAESFALPAPAAARDALGARVGQRVVVGVRPEDIRDPDRSPRGVSAALELTTDLLETLGDEMVVHASRGADSFAFEIDAQHAPELGEKVIVAIELERLHLFDADTERRIVY